MKPYIDEYVTENEWIRTFDPNVAENEEFVWHRDTSDRKVTVLEGSGWKFQFDNELPTFINIYETIFIPKVVYHRLIPGKEKLKVKIKESQ